VVWGVRSAEKEWGDSGFCVAVPEDRATDLSREPLLGDHQSIEGSQV
jgi:hypothetical protein